MKTIQKSAETSKRLRLICLPVVLIMVFVFGCTDDGFKDAINNEIGDEPPSPGNSGIVAASYITPTTLDVRWLDARDDLTSPSHLKYRVFVSMSSFSSVPEAEIGGVELTAGWTLGISSLQALIPSGTVYLWCNVFVSDENENISIYRGVAPFRYANTAPETDGNSLVVTNTVPLSVNLAWTKATDLQTPQTSLRYRVFYAESPSDVNTFAHAEAGGIEVTSDWTYDIGTIQVNVPEGGMWWFNVFVIDGGGLVSGYVQNNSVVASRTAPVIADPVITLSPEVESVGISWFKASDPDGGTPQEFLQYRIYYATSRSVLESDRPPSSDAAMDVTRGWITFDPSNSNTLKSCASGLVPGTIYYFRVYVRDLDLMISSYEISYCTVSAGSYSSSGGGGVMAAVPKAAKKVELSRTVDCKFRPNGEPELL